MAWICLAMACTESRFDAPHSNPSQPLVTLDASISRDGEPNGVLAPTCRASAAARDALFDCLYDAVRNQLGRRGRFRFELNVHADVDGGAAVVTEGDASAPPRCAEAFRRDVVMDPGASCVFVAEGPAPKWSLTQTR